MKGKFTKKVRQVIALLLLMILSASSKYFVSSANDENKEIAQAQVEVAIEKYVNYDVDNEKGVLVQLGVETGIEYEDEENQLPVLVSGVQLWTPQIEGKFPKSVELENKDKNTNKEPQLLYNQATGEIRIIKINMLELSGEATVEVNSEDAVEKYSVILNYGEESYNGENKERELEFKSKAVKILGDNQNTKISIDKEQKETVKENNGEIITVKSNAEEIYNGYIKANKKYGTKYSTNYEETVEIEIGKAGLGEQTSVLLETKLDNEETQTDKILFDTTQINKQKVLKILGEDGSLKITDKDGKTLGEVNKNTNVNEDGNYILRYNEQVSQISVVTTTPQKEGTITIINNKKIAPEVENTNLQIKENNQLKVEKTIKVENNNKNNEVTKEKAEEVKEIYTTKEEKTLEMKPSNSAIKVTLSNTEWTNEKQNEVNFEIELQNNNSKYNLFKNPSFEIKLPEEANKVIIEDEPTLINGNGLQVASAQYNEENKTIKLELYGEQKQYLPANIAQGTKIELPVIVILNDEIEDKEEKIQINYKNINVLDDGKNESVNGEKTITLHNFNQSIQDTDNYSLTNAEFRSVREDIVEAGTTVQTDSGLEVTITPVRGDVELNDGDTVYEGEFIRYEITAKNTTDHDIENVKFEAEIPNDFVFYETHESENGERSYYTYEEEEKEIIEESDNISVKYNESTQEKEIGIEEIKKGETVKGVFEVKARDLNECAKKNNVKDSEDMQFLNQINTKIEQLQELLSDEDRLNELAENNNNNQSTDKFEENKEKIKLELNNDKKILEKIKEKIIWRNEQNATVNIKAFIGDNLYYNRNFSSIIKHSDISVQVQVKEIQGLEYKYYITVNKTNNEEAIIKFPIAEYLDIYNIDAEYICENNNAVIRITNENEICVNLIRNREPKNDFLETTVTVNDKYKSNKNIVQLEYKALEINIQAENQGEKVKYGDEIVYDISINNTSKAKDSNINNYNINTLIQANISDELIIKKIRIDEEEKNTGALKHEITIPYGETVNIKITATPKVVLKETKVKFSVIASERELEMEYEGMSSLNGLSFVPKKSITITHTILPLYEETEEIDGPSNPDNPDVPTNPDNPDTPANPEDPNKPSNQEKPNNYEEETTKKYSVSGIVWNDENGDGIKQENEQVLNGIEVYLLDNQANYLRKTVTNEKYVFNELNKGDYYIAVKYDTNKYHITKYIAKGENTSKATEQKIKLENKEITAGITELLNIQKDTNNINIGLTENKKFDFKVENYITKVTVETSKGTDVTEYNNLTLAKKEIKAKEINGAKITVEYKIKVTNNGEIAGTVGKIVDKIPTGFRITSNQVSNWVPNKENEIVSTELENKIILPGESKELNFVLTTTLDEEATGTFSNIVIIENINNEQNISETTIQNNTAKAELIISISTGAITYIIAIGVIALVIVLFATKLNKLRKISLYMFALLSVLASIVSLSNTNVNAVNYEFLSDDYSEVTVALIRDTDRAYRLIRDSYTVNLGTDGTWTVYNGSDRNLYLLQNSDGNFLVNGYNRDSNPDHFKRKVTGTPSSVKHQDWYYEDDCINKYHDDHVHTDECIPNCAKQKEDEHKSICKTWYDYWIIEGITAESGREDYDTHKINITDSATWNRLVAAFGGLGSAHTYVKEYKYEGRYSYDPSDNDDYNEDKKVVNERMSNRVATNGAVSFLGLRVQHDLRAFRQKDKYNAPDPEETVSPYDHYLNFRYFCIDQNRDAYGYADTSTGSMSMTKSDNFMENAALDNFYDFNMQGTRPWQRYIEGDYNWIITNRSPFYADVEEDHRAMGSTHFDENERYPYDENMGQMTVYKAKLEDKDETNKIDNSYETFITDLHESDRIIPTLELTYPDGGPIENVTSYYGCVSLNQEETSGGNYVYIGKDSKNMTLEKLGTVKVYKGDTPMGERNGYDYDNCVFTITFKDGSTKEASFSNKENFSDSQIEFLNANTDATLYTSQDLFDAGYFYIKIDKSLVGYGISNIHVDVSSDFCWEFKNGSATGCILYGVKGAENSYQRIISPPRTITIEGKEDFNEHNTRTWIWFAGGLEIKKKDQFTGKSGDITANRLNGIKFAIKQVGGGFLKCDSLGNYTDTVDVDSASKFITMQNGETYLEGSSASNPIRMIINIPTVTPMASNVAQYEIVEIEQVPLQPTNPGPEDFLLDYYGDIDDIRSNGQHQLKQEHITVDLVSGDLLRESRTTIYNNERTFTNIELKKIGQTQSGYINLNGVRFAIYDHTAGGWVKVNNKGVYIGTSSSYNNASAVVATNYNSSSKNASNFPANVTFTGSGTVFETNNEGWLFLRRFPVNHSYTVYEIDVGAYDELYKAWFSDDYCDSYFKKIDFELPKDSYNNNNNNADGIYTVDDDSAPSGQVLNIQDYGAFKIRKRISNTKAPLAGIGFKIRVQTSEGWRWMRFDRRRDDGTDEVRLFADRDKGEPESASDYYLTSDFSEATMIKLQDNGETETIYKVPIYKDGDRDSKPNNKRIYEVYEVYIPGEDDPDGFINLRDILTLDNSGDYKKLVEITDERLIGTEVRALSTFDLNPYINPTPVFGRYRSVVTVPHSTGWDSGIENDQAYITIRGNVWQEILKGKNTVSEPDNIRQPNDKSINGLEVRLENNDMLVKKTPNIDEEYEEQNYQVSTTQWNPDYGDGYYEFKFVLLNDSRSQQGLINGSYKVRFEYDGVTYQSVVPYYGDGEDTIPDDPKLSRIAEQYFRDNDEANMNRQDFNTKWTSIENGTAIDGITLKYHEEAWYEDEAEQCVKEVNLDERDPVNQIYELDGFDTTSSIVEVKSDKADFLINATTKKGKLKSYYEKLVEDRRIRNETHNSFENVVRSIDNINLGLYYRERPNLTLQKDEHMAYVTVAGKAYTYFYNPKIVEPTTTSEIEKVNTDTGVYAAKFDNKRERSLPVYESDVNYGTGDGQNSEQGIKAWITYRVKLQNASTNLYAKVNSINEYYTTLGKGVLEMQEIYLCDEFDRKEFNNNICLQKGIDYNIYDNGLDTNYTAKKIVFKNPIELSCATAGHSIKYLYIKYEIKDVREYFYSVNPDNDDGIPNSEIENYAEIASYTLYRNEFEPSKPYDPKNIYPAVDRTSIPGNMDVSSYKASKERLRSGEGVDDSDAYILEDDSDSALGLRVFKAEERKIEGVVFEDAPVKEFRENGQTRILDHVKEKLPVLGTVNTAYQNVEWQDVCVGGDTINGKIDTGEERLGNGIYDPDDTENNMSDSKGNLYVDKGIENVKVSIKQVDSSGKSTGKNGLRWKHIDGDSNHGEWVEAEVVQTDSNGFYSISGMAPGEYLAEFEWGANQGGKDVRDYKCTVFTNTAGHINFDTNEIVMDKGLHWIYAEETKRYSDAIDNYETRLAVDDKELGLGNGNGDSITEEDLENITMVSSTAPFKLGIEMKTEEEDGNIDDGKFYEENGNTYYDGKPGVLTSPENVISYLAFHIDKIDFGIIERPRQALGVEKHLLSVKINTADGRQVAIAYIGEDNKLTVVTGAEYLSGGYDLGYLWVQVDKAIQESMTVQLEYKITVKNYSELDYSSNKYYFIGKLDGELIKLKADYLYDYIGGSLLDRDEDKWVKVKVDDETSVDSAQNDVYLFKPERVKTETEKDYLEYNKDPTKIDTYDYEPEVIKFYKNELYSDWNQAWKVDDTTDDQKIEKIRAFKLKDKDIVRPSSTNNLVQHAYVPGEVNTSKMDTAREISMSDAEVRFDNDVEIAKNEYEKGVIKTARRTDITLAPQYDRAEWVSITPATGENKDFIGLTIVAIGNLTMFACGIILIKRYLRKRK